MKYLTCLGEVNVDQLTETQRLTFLRLSEINPKTRNKQELGLGHYEGRGWRGFHHHASLSIAAYGFLMVQQLRHPEGAGKKALHDAKNLPYPRITSLAVAPRTQRHVPSSITTLRLLIAAALLKALPRCPCCLRANARLRL
jgi:hypothetical protein